MRPIWQYGKNVMDGLNSTSSLLKRLQELYSKVVLLIFKKRIDSYRNSIHIDDRTGFHRTLSAQIDKVATVDNEKGPGNTSNHPITDNNSTEIDKKRHSIKLLYKIWNSLGSYFRRSPRGTTYHQNMGERLKESVWDHSHAALRLARQGKLEQARLHVDIANNALMEVGHYMDESEFKAFSTEVQKSLNKV